MGNSSKIDLSIDVCNVEIFCVKMMDEIMQ